MYSISFLVERLLLGKGFGLAHGALGQFDVASALGDDGAHQGRGVVLHFHFHHVIHFFAAEDDGMRCARIGSRSHGGDVGRFENEEAGRCGAAAAGRHVDDDGNRRGDDLLDNFAGGIDQSSGSVDLDQDRLIVIGGGHGERAANVFGGDGLDGVVDAMRKTSAEQGATRNTVATMAKQKRAVRLFLRAESRELRADFVFMRLMAVTAAALSPRAWLRGCASGPGRRNCRARVAAPD
jgi:hypothetical protein